MFKRLSINNALRREPTMAPWEFPERTSSIDTPSLQLHMDHFPLEKIRKLELLSATKGKRTTLRQIGETETQSCKKPSPRAAKQQGEISPDSGFSQRVSAPCQAPHPWTCTVEMSPQNILLRKPMGLMSRVPKCYRKLRLPSWKAQRQSCLPQDLSKK